MKRQILTCAFALLLIGTSGTYGQKLDRSKPPELGPPPSLQLPAIQRFTLSNGLNIVLMEKHQVPVVQVNLLVNVGTAHDPANQRGLASMTAALMNEGAGERDALAFADAVEFLGASLSVSSGMHTTTVSLFTALSKLDSALALFADVVLRPRFPAEELERKRLERLTTLQQWHDEARTIASTKMSVLLYGPGHPYGPPALGNEQTIRSFSVEQLRSFYTTYFKPNNATLIVVGDVTPKAIIPKLEAQLGVWKGGSVPAPQWPAVSQVESRTVYLIDKPNAPQSVIRIGRIGVDRNTEDYYAISVMNTILGASFTSRLNSNLREQHGYSYSAGSRFGFMPLPGSFIASSDVHAEVTAKALSEFMKELRNIASVTDEELIRAKNYVALSYPSEFQSVGAIAGALAEMVIYNLPPTYFNMYTQNILSVTKNDVEAAARKYIDPEKIVIVVVGDKAKIAKGIEALNLGPVQYLTVEDVLGKPPVMDKK